MCAKNAKNVKKCRNVEQHNVINIFTKSFDAKKGFAVLIWLKENLYVAIFRFNQNNLPRKENSIGNYPSKVFFKNVT